MTWTQVGAWGGAPVTTGWQTGAPVVQARVPNPRRNAGGGVHFGTYNHGGRMKFTRHGEMKNRGYKSIWLDKPAIEWDAYSARVKITKTNVPDFADDPEPYRSFERPPALAVGGSRYKCTISLSLDEVRAVFQAVCAGAALKEKTRAGRVG
jgi:hypothetical protein